MIEMPVFRAIYEALRKDIVQGVFAPGSVLPSEQALSTRFGVARPTLRKSLSLLSHDGLIVKHQGKGSVVTGRPKGIGILSVWGTTSALEGRIRTHVVAGPEHRSWTEAFHFPLTERQQSLGCLYFERLRYLNDKPIFLDLTCLPAEPFIRDFPGAQLEDGSLFELLRQRYDLHIAGGVQQLFALKADRQVCAALHVPYGSPVLELNRRIETSREGYCFFSRLYCATKGFGLMGSF